MSGETANFGGSQLTGLPNLTATGRVTAVVADPQLSGRIFVGTAGGGVWMTTNGGTTFTLISASLPSQAIGAIAIDSVNTTPTTIYVATGEGNNCTDCYYGKGIFKSTDLGNTWTAILPVGYAVPGSSEVLGHPSFTTLAIDTSHNPPYLFATADFGFSDNCAGVSVGQGIAANDGLWRSPDGGSTWSHYTGSTNFSACTYLFGPCPDEDVVIDPANPNQVYVAVAFSGVWRSQDSGNTWTQMVLPGFQGLRAARASQ